MLHNRLSKNRARRVLRQAHHCACAQLGILCASLFAIASNGSEVAQDWRPVPVEIKQTPEGWQLLRGGQPYYVKGAGGDVYKLDLLRSLGANSIRTWGVGDGRVLEEAAARGMTVLVCLDIASERFGFDYDDEDAVAAQLERARSAVRRFKNHPALLGWMIGNELNLMHTNPKVWDAVNDISKMIHEEDGLHPTTTALAGLDESTYALIQARAPDLDFLSTQVYGMLTVLAEHVASIGIEMPMMVTEWGTVGHWELPQTTWGAPIELTSTEKSAHYLKGYQTSIEPFADQVIGSYVFLWGQKQERTPTWYGMFTPSGEVTEPVDAVEKLWRGQWPEDRSPFIEVLFLADQTAHENVVLESGQLYDVVLEAGDYEGDALSYEWVVMEESRASEIGGDREIIPAVIPGLVAAPRAETQLRAPRKPGAYRLFGYVRDPQGKVAHANLPFKVE